MKRFAKRALGLGLVFCASLCIANIAHAQAAPPALATGIDANGVDRMSGTFYVPQLSVSIGGPGNMGMHYQRVYDSSVSGGVWRDNVQGTINDITHPGAGVSGLIGPLDVVVVTVSGMSESFTGDGSGNFVSNQGTGAGLEWAGSDWFYFAQDGTTADFTTSMHNSSGPILSTDGLLTTLTRPNQAVETYSYTNYGTVGAPVYRVQGVTSTLGYELHFQFDDAHSQPSVLIGVTAINLGVDYCDPTAFTCTALTQSWPSLAFQNNAVLPMTVTDSLSRTTSYSDSAGVFTVTPPVGAARTIHHTTGSGGRTATSVSNGTGTWSYSQTLVSGVFTMTVTDPLTHTQVIKSKSQSSGFQHRNITVSQQDGLSRITAITFDTFDRPTQITKPEGDEIQYTYDSNGNLSQTTLVPKPGSGLPNIVTSAVFPGPWFGNLPCDPTNPVYPVYCHQPVSSTDANGNETDYTYDSGTGLVKTITLPAPAVGGIRPVIAVTSASQTAKYKNSAGTLVNAPSSVSLPTQISECQTLATCTGSNADRTQIAYTYGSGFGVANNLLLTQTVAANGSGTLSATTKYTYDEYGNLQTVDGPLTETADTTTYRYDADRELIGVVGPDPDGAGSLKNRATRVTYNGNGQPTLLEQGTVNSPSDADWAAFSTITQYAANYDTVGRVTEVSQSTSGTTLSATQTSYDNANRVTCTAVRMNPAVFGSLPTSACTLSTVSSNGPDRIASNTYDNADELTVVTTGYGTPSPRNDVTRTYGSNGEVATEADAKSNLTTYDYDGFNRMVKVQFPSPTTVGVSSTTDFEQYAYDAASNVTQDQRRDGNQINYAYDFMNRVTTVTPPSPELAITYAYDNLSRVTSVATSSQTLSLAWDALSRKTGETSPLAAMAFQYDLAGNRTRITWPDGLYAQYVYDNASELTAVEENGATSGIGLLATFSYDNLGRRTGLTRGNGVTSTYGYDGASNLTGLALNLSGTTNDQTLTFGYNSAGQIISRAGSNAAYTWNGPYAVSRGYTTNGQNQYTAAGTASFSYDGRGNLSSDGTNSYGYDSQNNLTSMGAATLAYDPAQRLSKSVGGGVTTQFNYDGMTMLGEYDNSGALLRRYVPGPNADEPLVWYEGTGTAARRWFVADNLGSILAITDSTGAASNINTYDDYGIPGASNSGRFQYSGQAWIAEIGLYDDKARTYSPTLGRFLQVDPMGYADGMNAFAYVRNDAVNLRDPTGMTAQGCYINDSSTCVSGIVVTSSLCSVLMCGGGGLGLTGIGYFGPALGSASYSNKEHDKAEEKDLDKCRGLSDPGARSRCYESANKRDYARRNDRPLPPLITWKTAAVGGGLIVVGVGGVVCAVMEPCGAVAVAGLGIAGAVELLTQ